MSWNQENPQHLICVNQFAWKRARTLTNALQMEQSFGCELSPCAKVLLDNLSKLVKEQIELNSGIKHL